jgi:hypothetical protein
MPVPYRVGGEGIERRCVRSAASPGRDWRVDDGDYGDDGGDDQAGWDRRIAALWRPWPSLGCYGVYRAGANDPGGSVRAGGHRAGLSRVACAFPGSDLVALMNQGPCATMRFKDP